MKIGEVYINPSAITSGAVITSGVRKRVYINMMGITYAFDKPEEAEQAEALLDDQNAFWESFGKSWSTSAATEDKSNVR